MKKVYEPFEGIRICFTDEPEIAEIFAASGLCFIALAGMKGADGYVEKTEDFEELSDEYLLRIYKHHIKENYELFRENGMALRECDRYDYQFICRLLQENYEAVKEYDDGIWTDDITSALQFEKYVREYYALFDFGAWILEIDGKRAGLFSLTDGEGVELSYIMDEPYRRRGIAFFVAKKVLEYAKEELAIERVRLYCNKNNKPSRRLAERLGFTLYMSEGDGGGSELCFIKEL